ncbi:MAG: AMP-binding protein, partial [Erythrobacter sp.]
MTDAALTPTPNDCDLPRIRAKFDTFNDAIDYAARSEKGLNFHDMRGQLERVYPYSEMREDALATARRLIAAGIGPQDRVAIIAETCADFAALFCGCVYAGAWPVPLPLPTTFGGKESYIDQLAIQLESSDPAILLYPEDIAELASAAAKRQDCAAESWQDFAKREAEPCDLPEASAQDICYLQYSSGSTRFPTGVAVTHEALLHNLVGHAETMALGENDRVVSWLPW